MIRYKCANCQYVFDTTDRIPAVNCPKCGTNACDPVTGKVLSQWSKEAGVEFDEMFKHLGKFLDKAL